MLDFFFSPERPLALGINILILVLAGGSLGVLLRAWTKARREIGDVSALESPLKHVRRKEQNRSEIKRIVREHAEEVGEGSLVRQRIEDLQDMGDQAEIDMAGLTALSRETLRDEVAFPASIGPILILLGLTGTLWGLGFAVTELATTLDTTESLSTAILRDEILATLGGMQTAFSTTLLGILGTVVVKGALDAVRHTQSKLLRRLERLLVTGLVPVYQVSERTALPEAAKSLSAVQKTLKEDLGRLVDGVHERGEALGEQLQEEFLRLEKAFQERAEKLLKETARAMDAVMEMLGSRDPSDPSLADYVRAVQSTTSDLKESVTTTSSLIPKLEDSLTEVISEQHTSLRDALTAYSDRVGPILENQERATRALAETAETSSESMDGLREQLGSLATSFEAARASWERMDQLVEDVGEACARAIADGLNQFVRELKEQRQATDAERERVAAAIARLQDSLTETLSRLQDERTAAQERSLEVLETTRQVLNDGLERMMQSTGDQQESLVKSIERGLRDLSHEIRDLQLGRTDSGRARMEGRGTTEDLSWDAPSVAQDGHPSDTSEL